MNKINLLAATVATANAECTFSKVNHGAVNIPYDKENGDYSEYIQNAQGLEIAGTTVGVDCMIESCDLRGPTG